MLLVGPLPTMYGAWLHVMTGLTQHAGLAEDVLDHRLNCRTVYMNPVLRFLYWNMNYHIEHHMFPMVPYHALAEAPRGTEAVDAASLMRAASTPIARSSRRSCARRAIRLVCRATIAGRS